MARELEDATLQARLQDALLDAVVAEAHDGVPQRRDLRGAKRGGARDLDGACREPGVALDELGDLLGGRARIAGQLHQLDGHHR